MKGLNCCCLVCKVSFSLHTGISISAQASTLSSHKEVLNTVHKFPSAIGYTHMCIPEIRILYNFIWAALLICNFCLRCCLICVLYSFDFKQHRVFLITATCIRVISFRHYLRRLVAGSTTRGFDGSVPSFKIPINQQRETNQSD